MITEKQALYLIDEIILNDIEDNLKKSITIDNTVVKIEINSKQYSEPIFDFNNVTLTNEDIKLFDNIITLIDECGSNIKKLLNVFNDTDLDFNGYLKCIHFFANEHYLTTNVIYDEHGRITSDSVMPIYRKYLEFPILDILISLLFCKLKISSSRYKTIYFTCDYDTLNFWPRIGIWGFIKREIKNILRFRLLLSSKELVSFFLADKFLKWNFYLNDSMFFLPKERTLTNFSVNNIAFMLVKKDNKYYDIDNNFEAKPFKQFYRKLKENNIEIGIHPNYNTTGDEESLKNQIKLFVLHFNQMPKISRSHYLKINFPEDLHLLSKNDIKTDYSYCFADSLLYRGGRAKAIKLWDFKCNDAVDVQSIPLTIMDNILDFQLNYNLEESLNVCKKKILYSLAFGSSLTLLWHNTFMYKFHYNGNYHPTLFKELKKYIIKLDKEISNLN